MTTNDRTMGHEKGVEWAMTNAPDDECHLVADWINDSKVPATIRVEDLPRTRRRLHTAFGVGLSSEAPMDVDDFVAGFLEGMAAGWWEGSDDLDDEAEAEAEADAEVLVLVEDGPDQADRIELLERRVDRLEEIIAQLGDVASAISRRTTT